MPRFSSLIKAAADRIYPAALAWRKTRDAVYIRRYDRFRKRHPHTGPVRVGFVAQVPEVWDKQMSLFEYMLEDDRFDPRIVFVHPFNYVTMRISSDGSEQKAFYASQYGADRVVDFSSGSFRDPDAFDYLFYDRPFNHYLPKALQTHQAAKHARLCSILYGAYDWDIPFEYEDFAAGVAFWFGSNEYEYQAHRKTFGGKDVRKAFDAGYPAYEYYHGLDSAPGKNRILWTPRWIYDKRVGGSHFLEYVEKWIEFVKRNNVSLVIRPHPLMFENMLREGLMTAEEIQALKDRCAEAGIRFDPNRIIADTFRETDILVSDYSSVLGLFLAMDKPIVYCPGNIPFTPSFRMQETVMYHAENWDGIEKQLDSLLQGNDPMKEKRQDVIRQCLLRKPGAAEKIAEIIYLDYSNRI